MLDAGCGTGRLTAELAEALPGGRVVGIDLSQNMLAGARDHLRSQLIVPVGLVAADLLHLPFERAFDGIVSTAAFHWVLDHDRLFLELRRSLRPGGWLEAQCGGGANVAGLRKRALALASTPQFSAFFADFREPWFYADAEGAAAVELPLLRGAMGGERPQNSEGERAGSSRAMPAPEGGLAHEDVQKLQAALHDLTECRRLLDAALAQKI